MNGLDEPHTRMRTAIVFSIAAHLCALLALALFFVDAGSATANAPENGSGAAVTLFVRREPKPRPRALAVRTPPPRAVAVRETAGPIPRRRRRPKPWAPHDSSQPPIRQAVPLERTAPAVAPAVMAVVYPAASDAPAARATRAPTPTPTPLPSRPPTPAPTVVPSAENTPAPTTAPTAVAAGNFGGLFSQNYPPALRAPAELDAIRSRLSRPVHIRVDVDESGRATDVHFLQPVADPVLAQEVRSALLALRYVPADCNGLHCEGTLEIAY
jgi:outer membrane biosynthesis protein TonB